MVQSPLSGLFDATGPVQLLVVEPTVLLLGDVSIWSVVFSLGISHLRSREESQVG